MASAFVSKSRKVRFDLTLRIIDLNNVPLVSGTSFVKWDLPSSTAAEHRGRTQKSAIKDHRVQYDYVKQLPVRMVVGRDGVLQECMIHFEVTQEYSSAGRGERITLGEIRLNLAEYVDALETLSPTEQDADEGITRRYLMQDSKINSTLKVGVAMKQVEGTREFKAPQLRSAPVFGGIAGIISSSEPASTVHGVASTVNPDSTHELTDAVPSLSTSRREVGEMQDMYRRTLAAFWASQPGELKADECIEDIFAGGDGWGKNGPPATAKRKEPGAGTGVPNTESGMTSRGESSNTGHSRSSSGGIHMHHNFPSFDDKPQSSRKGAVELDEMDVRDDLSSWHIGIKATH